MDGSELKKKQQNPCMLSWPEFSNFVSFGVLLCGNRRVSSSGLFRVLATICCLSIRLSCYNLSISIFCSKIVLLSLHSLLVCLRTFSLYLLIKFFSEYMCFHQTGDISTQNGSSLILVDKFTYLRNQCLINRDRHRHVTS